MKYAIISDIHANESALRHVLADATAQGADRTICLGDVVGYGPLPRETLALTKKSCAVVLAGNHDDAVSGRQGADNFIALAGDAVKRHREVLTKDELAWLKTLPYKCTLADALAVHGDFINPKSFNYLDDEQTAADNFMATDTALMFVGHTHVPCIFLTGQSGKVYRLEPQDFVLEPGKRYIVNPGSVGYPRENNGTCQSSYVLYDAVKRTVCFRFLPFAVSSVMQRGTNSGRRAALVVAILLGIAAIASTALFVLRQPIAEKETVIEVMRADDPTLILSKKQLALTPDMSYVQANLKLDRKANPIELLTVFKSPTDDVLLQKSFTVSGSARQRIKIPAGASAVQFTVLKQKADDQPILESFAPSAK